MKFCAFDIEISKVLPDSSRDWHRHRPFGISCAATLRAGDPEPVLWYDGMHSGGAYFGSSMNREQVGQLVDYLLEVVDDGFVPLTWNGLSFDFSVLAEESGRFDDCVRLALNHVDMMYQFFCIKGFPVSLAAVCEGMGLPGKEGGLTGADAPVLWQKGQYQKVLDYVAGDVDRPLKIAEKVNLLKTLYWVTKRGSRSSVPIQKWLLVTAAMDLPEPDTSWMSKAMSRRQFFAWTKQGGPG